MSKMKYTSIATSLLFIVILTGCVDDNPPVNCGNYDVACVTGQFLNGMKVVRGNIEWWSGVYLLGQAVAAIAGIVATVMIALQGDDNRRWTRPVGLIATALVTGVTSTLVSLHVPDNVDKLVTILDKMAVNSNKFEFEAEKISKGKSNEEFKNEFNSNQQVRDAMVELVMVYVGKHNELKIEMLRLKGSAAKLNVDPATNRNPK